MKLFTFLLSVLATMSMLTTVLNVVADEMNHCDPMTVNTPHVPTFPEQEHLAGK